MKDSLDTLFCKLLRVALGLSHEFPNNLSDNDWNALFLMAKQQTLLGVLYNAFSQLPKESLPSRVVAIRWSGAAEMVRGVNRLMNQEAARYTQLFNKKGVKSVILKGQANARLYPDPLSRQAGDIDIWIPGGYDSVARILLEMRLISEKLFVDDKIHHIGFRNENNIDVEVHHKASSDILFRNKEFQELLLNEIDNVTLAPEGFYVPSIRFALLMQLVHLQHHFFYGGLGLRQYMDYYILLRHSTESDREYVWKCIKRFGLRYACSAVMGVLEKVFELPHEQMLCAPSKKRGLRLYKMAFDGGNFGKYAQTKNNVCFLKRWLKRRIHALQWFSFDPPNAFLREFQYWKNAISLIPVRIRHRRIALCHHDQEKKVLETLK
ncbi:MAG: nucleotidyltransferase family protein [Fibrobacter sp.]|nr:nucleotidyltransferase family protein [Fibrobacter sp.]